MKTRTLLAAALAAGKGSGFQPKSIDKPGKLG